jgi:predicted ribonuclease YlaK
LKGTQLSACNEKIIEITQWTSKLIGSLDPRIRSVYVFDTSALIEHPQIVAEASQGELFVVTKRVIEELDDKKLNETLRPSVAEAVRNLRNLSKDHIQFCDGDMSLLPADYRVKGDNLILSVAVRYRKHKPVLITNDNNLSLKARAEGLEAMSAESFLKRPRMRPQNATGKDRDRPQGQKGNQGKQRRKR